MSDKIDPNFKSGLIKTIEDSFKQRGMMSINPHYLQDNLDRIKDDPEPEIPARTGYWVAKKLDSMKHPVLIETIIVKADYMTKLEYNDFIWIRQIDMSDPEQCHYHLVLKGNRCLLLDNHIGDHQFNEEKE